MSESQGMELERLAGRNLRALRQSRGWPLREVAERMKAFGYNWHQTVVAKIETGDRPLRLSEALDLASLYGAGLNDLLGPLHPDVTLAIEQLDAQIAVAAARSEEANERFKAIQSAAEAAEREASAALAEVDRARERQILSEMELRTLEARRSMR